MHSFREGMLSSVLGSRFPSQSERQTDRRLDVCVLSVSISPCVLNFVHVCSPTQCCSNFHNWPKAHHDLAPLLRSCCFQLFVFIKLCFCSMSRTTIGLPQCHAGLPYETSQLLALFHTLNWCWRIAHPDTFPKRFSAGEKSNPD